MPVCTTKLRLSAAVSTNRGAASPGDTSAASGGLAGSRSACASRLAVNNLVNEELDSSSTTSPSSDKPSSVNSMLLSNVLSIFILPVFPLPSPPNHIPPDLPYFKYTADILPVALTNH